MSKVVNRILVFITILSAVYLVIGPTVKSYPEFENNGESTNRDELIPPGPENVLISLSGLKRHFPDEIIIAEVLTEEPLVVVEENREPVYSNELKFISSVVKDGRKSWFFKNSRNNRIYELSPGKQAPPWSWVSEEEGYFLLKQDNEIFKVRK